MNTAIITAAGKATRAGLGKNKNLYKIDGRTVIEKTVAAFLQVEEIDRIIVTAPKEEIEEFLSVLSPLSDKITVVEGGETRSKSVYNALTHARCDYVLIHDGARPFVSPELIKKCLYKAINEGSCVAAMPLVNTIGRIEGDKIVATERQNYLEIQTPQAFLYNDILTAFENADGDFTDDCGVYIANGGKCSYTLGEQTNIKLTTPDDFKNKEAYRVGTGFDLHRLVEGRKLILGGVEIPHEKGLLGHSDADVLTHAIMDSLLSALALRDIGYHFPDTDPKYKGACSMELLKEVLALIDKEGYKVSNVSATVMAEKPKLKGFIPQITQNLAAAMNLSPSAVGIGCTTLEGVGTVGHEEAIACQAYCAVTLK